VTLREWVDFTIWSPRCDCGAGMKSIKTPVISGGGRCTLHLACLQEGCPQYGKLCHEGNVGRVAPR